MNQQEMTVVMKDSNKNAITELKAINEIVSEVMTMPHYAKLGKQGCFLVVQMARSLGIDVFHSLNGALYPIQGKVEMSSQLMNSLIRDQGHSITKDKRSDNTICILHGKRKDNSDTWVESFSVDDAKLAGLYKNTYQKFPRDMLFARALSRLARQLFPDVIKGCYVEGEISKSPPINAPAPKEQEAIESIEEIEVKSSEKKDEPQFEMITEEQYVDLEEWIGDNMKLRQDILNHLKTKWKVDTIRHLPATLHQYALDRAMEDRAAAEQHLAEEQQAIGG